MDIHKPKPWHGWPEFLKEIGTIVIGVLIALGAEQAAEWLHWRHLAERADREMSAGLQVDLVNAMERTAIYPCQRDRLAVLAAALKAGGTQWKAAPMATPVGYRGIELVVGEAFHVPRPAWTDAAWQSAVASGAVNHMPHERVDAFAYAFRLSDEFLGFENKEVRLVSRLAALTIDHPMSEAERLEALKDLAELDRVEQMTTVASGWLMGAAKDLGVRTPSKIIAERLATQRAFRGACVREPVIPMPDPAVQAKKELRERGMER